MGKNNPENLFSRLSAERAPFGAEKRFTGGSEHHTPGNPTGVAGVLNGARRNGVDFGDVIGKELQNLYDDVVAQPVPDRFLSLLNQLEKSALSLDASSRAPRERE
jgi:hypothetical protein